MDDALFLSNTLTRSKERFAPIQPGEARLYSCGPTVYQYPHIGNLRAYVFADTLKRVLASNGSAVRHVINITDVGHLTLDEDTGEDKLELSAKKQNRTAWEIAEFFATIPAGGAVDRFRLIPARANRQPALAVYRSDPAGRAYRTFSLLVFTLDGDAIAEITAFHDSTLFPLFGLPALLEPDQAT